MSGFQPIIERLQVARTEEDFDAVDEALAKALNAACKVVNYDPQLWLIRNGGWTHSVNMTLDLAASLIPSWATALAGNKKSGWVATSVHRGVGKVQTDGPYDSPAVAHLMAVLMAADAENLRPAGEA